MPYRMIMEEETRCQGFCCVHRTASAALRKQQVLAYESGAGNTVDPLGGSYFVEALTDAAEQKALAYLEKIEEIGGDAHPSGPPALYYGAEDSELALADLRRVREFVAAAWSRLEAAGEERPL